MEDIDGAKQLISNELSSGKILYTGKPFSKYQVVYFSSNENVCDSINNIYNDDYDNALCVMASGDQVFELINKGVKNVDTFDKNRLTEYYVLGLKRAMILKYNYNEYLDTIKIFLNKETPVVTVAEIIYSLLPFMDLRYRKFWNEILDYSIDFQKSNINQYNLIRVMFINLGLSDKYNIKFSYLKDEETYNEFKDKLNKANINFKECNAFDLDKEFNKKYNMIYLSNILDYYYYDVGYEWGLNYLKNYQKVLNGLTTDKADILVHYIFNYYYGDHFCSNLINETNISYYDLKEYDLVKVKNVDKKGNVGDGNLIYRKR